MAKLNLKKKVFRYTKSIFVFEYFETLLRCTIVFEQIVWTFHKTLHFLKSCESILNCCIHIYKKKKIKKNTKCVNSAENAVFALSIIKITRRL